MTLVVAVSAVAALVLRVWWLARPGHLLGVVEADEGVLFGNALRFVSGVIPYRDFSDVQPPAAFLIITPVAALAKVTGSAWGLAIARMLTVGADTACVVAIGRLVRHRGALTAGIACGCYAVFPDALVASHAFLLEPWLNLCCLAGAVVLFDSGAITSSPRRLLCGGAVFGFAVAIKLWALVPLGIVAIILVLADRLSVRRTGGLAAGAVAGFAVPALPFWLLAPSAFVGGVFTGQFVRSGVGLYQVLLRLADLAGHLPSAAAVSVVSVAVLIVGAGYAFALARHATGALDVYCLACAVAVVVMVLLPRLYYSHYGSFAAPFIAMALGGAAGHLVSRIPAAAVATVAVCVTVLLGAAAVRDVVASSSVPAVPSVAIAKRLIPAGACVLTDTPSYTVAADRFTAAKPGCPALVDPQGTLIAMTDGEDLGAPPLVRDRVTALWRQGFARARYVWIFPGSGSRIPWNQALRAYFAANFRLIAFRDTFASGGPVPPSGLYVRR